MAEATFQTNPVSLQEFLKLCHTGQVQLPDFQRSWVWDEDRIKGLIASISRAFPVGALMTLKTGGVVNFKPRPIEGAPEGIRPEQAAALLLDGQQRMTSMYQVTLRGNVVRTRTPRGKDIDRWFYLDMRKCLDPTAEREEAIVSLPPDRKVPATSKAYAGLDLSTQEREFSELMFPLWQIFRWSDWSLEYFKYASNLGKLEEKWPILSSFQTEIVKNFEQYQIPVISLAASTTKEAVCTVFEKVNTGGKALDAFELVTAMFAAEGHELRKDWYGKGSDLGRQHRFVETLRHGGQRPDESILSQVSNTDFLQAVTLFHTRELRRAAEAKQSKDLPPVTPNRAAILSLPLSAYLKYEKQVEAGFVRAARFLHKLHIFRVFDLPYQTQVVPLAAILADIGEAADHVAINAKLVRWYWNGVFGELYGSAVESRFAKDFLEVPPWLQGTGALPSTIQDATFRPDRLKTMKMRLSAAYKGVNALLMDVGAIDWRSGQKFNDNVFFDESVDIHHIFPRKWCEDHKKPPEWDSIINKTPLSGKTNRIIGGVAPSEYLAKLQNGGAGAPPIEAGKLDDYLRSHLIDPARLRADNFESFIADRQSQLLGLIEKATGQTIRREAEASAAAEAETDAETLESELTMPAAQ